MKKKYSIFATTLAVATIFGVSFGHAVPTLQLDIGGGTYDWSSETMVANGSPFTLYALLTPDNDSGLGSTYYISAAVVPKFGPSGSNLGSFTFNAATIDVTADMTYGVPPLHDVDGGIVDSQDLSDHGIFDTYFTEFAFQFDSALTTQTYDAQKNSGGLVGTGTGSYYQAFSIDTSGIDYPYVIHFDLYQTSATRESILECVEWKNGKCKTSQVIGDMITDWDIIEKAPFSHDAQSSNQVPEPTTMLLFGTGLIGLAGLARRKYS